MVMETYKETTLLLGWCWTTHGCRPDFWPGPCRWRDMQPKKGEVEKHNWDISAWGYFILPNPKKEELTEKYEKSKLWSIWGELFLFRQNDRRECCEEQLNKIPDRRAFIISYTDFFGHWSGISSQLKISRIWVGNFWTILFVVTFASDDKWRI